MQKPGDLINCRRTRFLRPHAPLFKNQGSSEALCSVADEAKSCLRIPAPATTFRKVHLVKVHLVSSTEMNANQYHHHYNNKCIDGLNVGYPPRTHALTAYDRRFAVAKSLSCHGVVCPWQACSRASSVDIHLTTECD